MDAELLAIATEVFDAVNSLDETDFGDTVDSNFQLKMNDFEEGTGCTVKASIELCGPTLDGMKERGSEIYPDKSDEDLYAFVAIKVKSDPQSVIDTIQETISMMGLPVEMANEFGELKYVPGDGEVLIGFKANEMEHIGLARQFLLKPNVFGDGSEDVNMSLSFNLATTADELLDDSPVYGHILKGFSVHGNSHLFEKTKHNIWKVLSEKKDTLDPLKKIYPALIPLFFFKRVEGLLELECNDEMKQTITEFLTEMLPPSAMSLTEGMGMAKSMGIPLEMLEPSLNIIKESFDGEISVNLVGTGGIKIELLAPGLDQVVEKFLEA